MILPMPIQQLENLFHKFFLLCFLVFFSCSVLFFKFTTYVYVWSSLPSMSIIVYHFWIYILDSLPFHCVNFLWVVHHLSGCMSGHVYSFRLLLRSITMLKLLLFLSWTFLAYVLPTIGVPFIETPYRISFLWVYEYPFVQLSLWAVEWFLWCVLFSGVCLYFFPSSCFFFVFIWLLFQCISVDADSAQSIPPLEMGVVICWEQCGRHRGWRSETGLGKPMH